MKDKSCSVGQVYREIRECNFKSDVDRISRNLMDVSGLAPCPRSVAENWKRARSSLNFISRNHEKPYKYPNVSLRKKNQFARASGCSWTKRGGDEKSSGRRQELLATPRDGNLIWMALIVFSNSPNRLDWQLPGAKLRRANRVEISKPWLHLRGPIFRPRKLSLWTSSYRIRWKFPLL